MSTLAAKKCRPLPAGTPALTRAQIDALLKEVPDWAYDGKVIAKSWSFKNYYETMAFVNAVAWVAHREDHHPDTSFGYNRCRVNSARTRSEESPRTISSARQRSKR